MLWLRSRCSVIFLVSAVKLYECAINRIFLNLWTLEEVIKFVDLLSDHPISAGFSQPTAGRRCRNGMQYQKWAIFNYIWCVHQSFACRRSAVVDEVSIVFEHQRQLMNFLQQRTQSWRRCNNHAYSHVRANRQHSIAHMYLRQYYISSLSLSLTHTHTST